MTSPQTFTQVAPGVWTATAEIWSSLTTAIVAPDGTCLLVDPGITVAEITDRALETQRHGWHVTAGFATHPHWDHVLWHQDLPDVPRWATAAAVAAQEATRAADLVKAEDMAPGHDPALFARLTALPDGSDRLPWPGRDVVVVRHDGHAVGHAALVVPDAGVMIAGDMLSDREIPLLDTDATDPIGDYRAALDVLEQAATAYDVQVLVPGHGHVGDAADLRRRLDADRAYLDELAAGRDPHDPRLADPWLAGEHAKHLERLGR